MATETTRKGYLLKWALTRGLIECEFVGSTDDQYYRVKSNRYSHFHERDIRWAREEAIAELNRRIDAKKMSIERQLAKLEKLAMKPKFTTEAKVWPERTL